MKKNKNKIKLSLLLGLISCFSALSTFSTIVNAEDLLTLYHLSLKNDPTFLASEAEMRATNEAVPQAFSRFLPSANFTLSTQANDNELLTQNHRFNTHSYTLNLTQPIFHPEHFSQLKQANYQKQIASITYALRKQQLILRLSQAYFNLLASLDDLQFTKAQRTAFAKELEQAEQRFQVGLIAITEVHEAKAKRDLALANEVSAKNIVANNKEKLIEIIGIDVKALAPLQKKIALQKPIPEDQSLWINAALKNNLTLQIAQKNALIAKYNIFNAQSGHMPSVDFQATTDKSKVPPSSFFGGKEVFRNNTVSLNLTVPIFQGGAVISKTREASARFDQASREVDLQVRTRTSETLQAYRSISSSISELHALAQAVISNQIALDAIRAAYEVGTRIVLDVLDAETSLLSAQRDYSLARYKYIIQSLTLRSEAGSLNEEDILQINQMLIQNMQHWPEQYLPANYLP